MEIDLSDFTTRLYAMLPSLALMPDIETPPPSLSATATTTTTTTTALAQPSVSDTLFRALELAFSHRTSASGASSPPWRSAAFAKRLLTASLQWPAPTAARAVAFVGSLLERDPKLEALLSTEDRSVDGVYRPELDDPQLCNPFGTSLWELPVLARTHGSPQVRDAAEKLLHRTAP